MRILPGQVADRDIWAYTDHSSYTVKSGYWMATNVVKNNSAHNTLQNQDASVLKKKIWNVKTLPKIRISMESSIRRLVVAERLNTRGMRLDTMCKICNAGSESINQVLFQYVPARDILHAVNFPPDTSNHRSLTENLLLALAMTSDTDTINGDRKAIPWLLWSIWKNRNAILYSGVQDSIAFITQRAITDAATWTSINYPPTTTEDAVDTLGITKTWQRPEPGIVKCNAHWRNDTSLGELGFPEITMATFFMMLEMLSRVLQIG